MTYDLVLSDEVSEILGQTAVASRQFKKTSISVLCSSNLPAASALAYHILPGRPDSALEVTSWPVPAEGLAGRSFTSPPGIPCAHVQEAALRNHGGRNCSLSYWENTHGWTAECASFILLYIKEHPNSASCVNESPCSPLSTWNKWGEGQKLPAKQE